MKNILWLIIFTIYSSVVNAQTSNVNVQLVYSGFDFLIPPGQSAVGSNGGEDNFLVFRYGEQKGKRYLAFTDMSNDLSIKYGCEAIDFFSEVFESNGNEKCNRNELVNFKKVFLLGAEIGVWKGGDATAYYTIGDSQSFVFLFGNNRIIKIDTDFLTEGALKSVLAESMK